MNGLQGRAAIVTGAANGIGRAANIALDAVHITQVIGVSGGLTMHG